MVPGTYGSVIHTVIVYGSVAKGIFADKNIGDFKEYIRAILEYVEAEKE